MFDPTEKIEPSQSKVWVFGTTVFLSGSLLNFWSYGFAPQSVLAALESIQFVTNIMFGKFMLGVSVPAGCHAAAAAAAAFSVGSQRWAILFVARRKRFREGCTLGRFFASPARSLWWS